jgi:DNA polymerase-3 subunit delta'
MQALLEAASGQSQFAVWAIQSEKLAEARSEKLEPYLHVLYLLLEDLLHLREGAGTLRNPDQRDPLERLARNVSFQWLRAAVQKTDELIQLLRQNIQKNLALDAMVIELRVLAADR